MDKEIEKQILKLRQDALVSLDKAKSIELRANDYPDLRHYEGRWKKEVYCSASVNQNCTDFETRFNCGCCDDSPLEFWAFIETKNGRVYSDPPRIFIGQKNYFGFMTADLDWKEKLRAEKIPEALIEKMSERFEEQKEKAKKELEDSFDDNSQSFEPEPFI